MLLLREPEPIAEPVRVVSRADRQRGQPHHGCQLRAGGALQPPEFADAAGAPAVTGGDLASDVTDATDAERAILTTPASVASADEPA